MRSHPAQCVSTFLAILVSCAAGQPIHAGPSDSVSMTTPFGHRVVVDRTGVVDWVMDQSPAPEIDQLNFKTYYFRVGETGPAIPLSDLQVTWFNLNSNNPQFIYKYVDPSRPGVGDGWELELSYFITSSTRTRTELRETFYLNDGTRGALAGEQLHIFQFSDFDLLSTPSDDVVRADARSAIIRDAGNGRPSFVRVDFTRDATARDAVRYEAGPASDLFAKFAGPGFPVLDPLHSGEAFDFQDRDLAFAHEWTIPFTDQGECNPPSKLSNLKVEALT